MKSWKSCLRRNADKLYVREVLIVIAVILGLGLYFRLTIAEYQSYNKVLNATTF